MINKKYNVEFYGILRNAKIKLCEMMKVISSAGCFLGNINVFSVSLAEKSVQDAAKILILAGLSERELGLLGSKAFPALSFPGSKELSSTSSEAEAVKLGKALGSVKRSRVHPSLPVNHFEDVNVNGILQHVGIASKKFFLRNFGKTLLS